MATLASFYGPEIAARAELPLPAGYVPYRACREYFSREAIATSRLRPIGREGAWGVAWRHGPFRFEKFVSDAEPRPESEGPLRIVIWQRLMRRDAPRGWWTATAGMGFRLTGLVALDGANEKDWGAHARRHAAKWRRLAASGEREALPLSLDEYLAAHAKADLDPFVKLAFPKLIRDTAKAHGDRLHLIGSRRRGGPIDAGFAFLDVPEAGHSLHVAAFVFGDAKEDSAATGLIMRWFEMSRAAGTRFLDFGFFWAPGDPRDWQGFSRFKSQFGVRLIRYPLPLMRFAGSMFGRAG